METHDTGLIISRISRHANYRDAEIDPRYLPLSRSDFVRVVKLLGIIPSFIYMRSDAGASGSFSCYTKRDGNGRVQTISTVYQEPAQGEGGAYDVTDQGLTMRVPHSPNNEVKSIWSLALTWNPEGLYTTGIFDGASEDDTKFLVDSINAESHFHPLNIPLSLLELLTVKYTTMRRQLTRTLIQLESGIGLIRGNEPLSNSIWHWNESKLRLLIKEVNLMNTGLSYMERRYDFAIRFAKFLQKVSLVQSARLPNESQLILETTIERVQNTQYFLDNGMHHIQSLQKRTAALITVVSLRFNYSCV